eukprot:10080880-Ditylum_brightwellii.AAC.1
MQPGYSRIASPMALCCIWACTRGRGSHRCGMTGDKAAHNGTMLDHVPRPVEGSILIARRYLKMQRGTITGSSKSAGTSRRWDQKTMARSVLSTGDWTPTD